MQELRIFCAVNVSRETLTERMLKMSIAKVKTGARILNVPVALIRSNPLHPRIYFDDESIERLALSVSAIGIIEPLTVYENETRGYTLLSGERRLRAAQKAGLTRVPCILLDTVTTERFFAGLVQDTQSKKLNFFEEAMVIDKLCSVTGLDCGEAAVRLGISSDEVQNKLRLLRIPAEMRRAVVENGLTERHVNLLLRLPSDSDKEILLREIVTGRLNVSQASKKCSEILASGRKKQGTIVRYFADITVFVNSVEKAVNTMLSSGIGARFKRRETENTVDFLISIPKNG